MNNWAQTDNDDHGPGPSPGSLYQLKPDRLADGFWEYFVTIKAVKAVQSILNTCSSQFSSTELIFFFYCFTLIASTNIVVHFFNRLVLPVNASQVSLKGTSSNSVDPAKTAHNAASDQDLHNFN